MVKKQSVVSTSKATEIKTDQQMGQFLFTYLLLTELDNVRENSETLKRASPFDQNHVFEWRMFGYRT